MLGPTRPDRLTIWPVEDGRFGIDVRGGGGEGNQRATVVRNLLSESGIKAKLAHSIDAAGGSFGLGRCRARTWPR